MDEFVRPFNITLSDGTVLHGAEFPSGHAFVDVGIGVQQTDLDDLPWDGAVITWASPPEG